MASPSSPSASPSRLSRITGALLAHHAGDSLGATLEFKNHAQIAKLYPSGLAEIVGGGPFKWSAGHATDDTDMTRGVLLAYRDIFCPPSSASSKSHNQAPERTKSQVSDGNGGELTRRLAIRAGTHFLAWEQGDWPGRRPGTRPADMGGATMDGLERFARTMDPDRAGAGVGSAGNGSLMRCLPTGLFRSCANDAARDCLVAESMRISKITHDDPRCMVSCAAYNAMASSLVAGKSPREAVAAGEAVAAYLEDVGNSNTSSNSNSNNNDNKIRPVCAAIQLGRGVTVANMAARGPPKDTMPGMCSGYVLESLAVAVAALLDERSLETVLVDVVRIGCDTDTNAAIAGGLLGARHGVEAIPERWLRVLQFRSEFVSLAAEIVSAMPARGRH